MYIDTDMKSEAGFRVTVSNQLHSKNSNRQADFYYRKVFHFDTVWNRAPSTIDKNVEIMGWNNSFAFPQA